MSAVGVTNITQLTYDTEIGYSDPSWSPDGSKIVYNYILGSNYSLWIMNANGSNPVPLTRADFNNPIHRTSAYWVDSRPRFWSSDGSKIIFQRIYYDDGRDNRGNFIYIINADGSNQRKLLGAVRNPAVSPDGRYIVFDAGGVDGVPVTPEEGYGIYIMNIDGTNIKRLTDDFGDEVTPSWSPDGTKIIFYSSIPPDAKTNLYIMTLDFNVTTPIPALTATQTPMVTQTAMITPTATTTPAPGIPGFSSLAAFVSLLIIVLIKRKRVS